MTIIPELTGEQMAEIHNLDGPLSRDVIGPVEFYERIRALEPPPCASGSAMADVRDLLDHLKLAASRLERLALEAPFNNPKRSQMWDWADEARAVTIKYWRRLSGPHAQDM